jgi:putative endonuclease
MKRRPDYNFYVYIISNRSRTLYTGITNDLTWRVSEHFDRKGRGFTQQYRFTRLVYFEHFVYVNDAIRREKQIKGWRRSKKVALIESVNPVWADLLKTMESNPDWIDAHMKL